MTVEVESLMGLDKIYKEFDLAAGELSRQLGVPICVEHCGRCCEETVPFIFRLEAIFTLSKALGTGRYTGIVKEAEAWLLERHSCASTYEGPYLGALNDKLESEFYAVAHSPCPFLTGDKRCSVHFTRPLVCRAYGVTHMSGPFADYCPRPKGIGESTAQAAWIDIPNIKTKILTLMGAQEDSDLKVTGLYPTALFKFAEPEKYRDYIGDNKIATAKLIGLPDKFLGMITQEQMIKEYAKK